MGVALALDDNAAAAAADDDTDVIHTQAK